MNGCQGYDLKALHFPYLAHWDLFLLALSLHASNGEEKYILLAAGISSLRNVCVKPKALFTLASGAYTLRFIRGKKKPHLILYLDENHYTDGDEY